jgi:hypothetical protein
MNKKAVAMLKFANSRLKSALHPITLNSTNNNKMKNNLKIVIKLKR